MKKDNYHNIFALLFDWLVIFGSRMRAFDNLMHEACHCSLFTNKFYNKWITCIFIAFPILQVLLHIVILTFNIIGIYGMKKMIDTKRYRIVGLDKPQENINKFTKDHIIKVLLLFHVPKYILGTVSANLYSKDIPKSELWIRNILWLVLISTSIVFNFWFYLIIFWCVPFLTTFQIIRYWAEMAEHSD